MRHLVRDISRVLTLFLASRQAWPKILGGKFRCLGGNFPPKRCLDKTLPYVRSGNTWTDMYACCPLVSHVEYAPRVLSRLEKRLDRQANGQTDGRQTVTLSLPLDVVSVIIKIISGQRILTKGRIVCRAVIEDWMIPFWCVHRSRDSRCFLMGRTTPKIAPSHVGDLDFWHGSLGPPKSTLQSAFRSVQPFLESSRTCQTHRPWYSFCVRACYAA